MESLQDRAVKAIHEKFHALPKKSKPGTLTNGTQEWVPLSGIVVIGDNESITCLALATGMKCLPESRLSILDGGAVLHDCHAETLAIRAFNHFLLQECRQLASCASYTSDVLQLRQSSELSEIQNLPPFRIHPSLRIMMYCSEAPCGDASMELVMEAQDDPTPWPVPTGLEERTSALPGRGFFSELGVVRRKPGKLSRLLALVLLLITYMKKLELTAQSPCPNHVQTSLHSSNARRCYLRRSRFWSRLEMHTLTF